MAVAIARETYLRDICRALEPAHIPVIGTTDGAGSDTTLVDSKLALGSSVDSGFFNGWWARSDESGAADAGQTRRITSFAGSTGTITVGAAYGAAPGSGSKYSLWRLIHPQVAEDFLNDILRRMRRETTYAVTALNERISNGDGNMDPSVDTDATAWNANSDNANQTLTKDSGAGNHYFGTYALKAVDDGGGAVTIESPAVPVLEKEQWLVSALVRVASTSGKVTMTPWNETDGSAIGTDTATTEEVGWQELELPIQTIPADCEQLAVRFVGTDTDDEFYIDHVVLWKATELWVDIPPWVVDPADVYGIGWYERGIDYQGTYAYTFGERPFRQLSIPLPEAIEVDEAFGDIESTATDRIGTYRLRLPDDYRTHRPLYLKLGRPYNVLDADGEYSTADRDVVVQAVLWEIFNDLATQAVPDSDEQASFIERRNTYAQLGAQAGHSKRYNKRGFRAKGLQHARR